MNWHFHFCSPAFPNDPAIEFNRKFQLVVLIFILILYSLTYTFYHLGFLHQQQDQQTMSQTEEKQKGSESRRMRRKDRLMGVGEEGRKEKDGEELNSMEVSEAESVLYLKSSYIRKDTDEIKQSQGKKKQKAQNYVIENLQSYFPIVYGHFSITVSLSLLYTPYFLQSLMIFINGIVSIMILIACCRKKQMCLKYLWIIMGLIIILLLMMSMVQIGQTDYSRRDKNCYALVYMPIY